MTPFTDMSSPATPTSNLQWSPRQVLASVAAGGLLLATGARAAGYPDKAIKIIVPFAPGAGTDAMGRLLAQKLGELLNVSAVVENKTGASGTTGAQFVAQSPADGYTLLLAAATLDVGVQPRLAGQQFGRIGGLCQNTPGSAQLRVGGRRRHQPFGAGATQGAAGCSGLVRGDHAVHGLVAQQLFKRRGQRRVGEQGV